MRGDRPCRYIHLAEVIAFTPHARGSTGSRLRERGWISVYPACAGIDLLSTHWILAIMGLPRMRGDRPHQCIPLRPGDRFTPHARGSTALFWFLSSVIMVYPACAGIDLAVNDNHRFVCSLPRMRGDRPNWCIRLYNECRFTPHARGSTQDFSRFPILFFVYPACAGIDPLDGVR